MRSFTDKGWLSLVTIPGREATVDAPAVQGGPVVGQDWPNWNFQAWILLPYVEPVVVPPTVPEDPCKWLLDVGPFFDRMGLAYYAASNSSDDFVRGFVPNLLSRHWVDLKRSDVIDGLLYMRGVTVPGLGTIAVPVPGVTQELTDWILGTPAQGDENLVLRKLFFS